MTQSKPGRDVWAAMKSGLRGRCPGCRGGCLFRGYLRIADHCSECGTELHHHRADDAPPYFTIFLIGHLIVPWVWVVEVTYHPPIWLHFVLWLPLVVVLSLLFLPAVKGAILGMQWAMRMHGFALTQEHDDRSVPGDDVTVADIGARSR